VSLLHDLGLWFWRLLPGNPILVRVVSAAGKRSRHHWARVVYLVTLFAVMLIFGNNALSGQAASLGELAKQSTQTFFYVSLVQLFLMSFIAPVFCASAITQEKDANTFHILLTTPLSSAQIVLGMLFSRMYFVWVLLLSGLPIFCIIMIFGGVTLAEIWQSLLLAAATGLATGALAILIGIAKVGTRRTIFSFFLGLAAYLLAVFAIGASPWGQFPDAPAGTGTVARMSWLAPVHPFLSLLVVTGKTPAPDPAVVAAYGWPWRAMLASPHIAYVWIMVLGSLVMVVASLFFVRRGAKEGESTLLGRAKGVITRQAPGERRQRPRRVWNNPIAWREAKTRGSAGGRSALRWFFIAGAAGVGFVLLLAHHNGWWGLNPNAPALTRPVLTRLIWIELAVVLLVVTNTAATTLTRERESQTMELLLTTPLTSKYILKGMLHGLVSFAVPLVAAPTITVLMFVLGDLFSRSAPVTTPEAALGVPLLMLAFCALAAIFGLYCSLQAKKTVQAVMWSTGVVTAAVAVLFGCGSALLGGGPIVGAALSPFMPFQALQSLVDYESLGSATLQVSPGELTQARVIRAITTPLSVAVYVALTAVIYNTMIRSFDMTVRRQSA